MQYTTALDAVPLWVVFLIVVMLVLAAIEGGTGWAVIGSTDRTRREGGARRRNGGSPHWGCWRSCWRSPSGLPRRGSIRASQLVLDEVNAMGND